MMTENENFQPTIRICGSIHPIELEWHCQCRKDPGHDGKHKCYGCGFEWELWDVHSRLPHEEADIAKDVALAESMYRPNGQWRHV